MQSRARNALRVTIAAVTIGAVAFFIRYQSSSGSNAPATGSDAKGKRNDKEGTLAGPAARAVPVLVSTVEQRDVPVWLEGLGSVAAWQQVLVRPQVEGILEKVYFKEGQTVRKGQLIAQTDARPFKVQLAQAKGALLRDEALLRGGKLTLARSEALLKQQFVTQQQVDDQRTTVGQHTGSIAVDTAQIASAKLNLDFTRIRAPLTGVCGIRLIDPGNLVRPTETGGIVLITQLDPAAVFVTLPQDELVALTAAQKRGEVVVEAWSRDGKARIGTGTLAVIDNQINAATATLRLKARVPNPDLALWPNQFVKARVLVDTLKNALVVPAASVQRGPQGTFVYVVAADDTAAIKMVEVGITTSESIVITKGVLAGDKVVVEGQNQLRPGAKVTARPLASAVGAESPAAPPEGAPGDRDAGAPERKAREPKPAPAGAGPGVGPIKAPKPAPETTLPEPLTPPARPHPSPAR